MGNYYNLFDSEADALINLMESESSRSSVVGHDDLTTTSAWFGDVAFLGDFAPDPEDVPIPFKLSCAKRMQMML